MRNENIACCVVCGEPRDSIEGFYYTGGGMRRDRTCKECRKADGHHRHKYRRGKSAGRMIAAEPMLQYLDPHARYNWKHRLTDEQKAEVTAALEHHEKMCQRLDCAADPRYLSEAVDEVVHGRSVWT